LNAPEAYPRCRRIPPTRRGECHSVQSVHCGEAVSIDGTVGAKRPVRGKKCTTERNRQRMWQHTYSTELGQLPQLNMLPHSYGGILFTGEQNSTLSIESVKFCSPMVRNVSCQCTEFHELGEYTVRVYKRSDNLDNHHSSRTLNSSPLDREKYREVHLVDVKFNTRSPSETKYTFRYYCETRKRVVVESHTFHAARDRGLL
jgi:hypothetical protein